MPCYHPLSAQRGADGTIRVGGVPGSNRFSDVFRWLYLPCGSCVGCVKSRARDWAIRCSLELQYHDVACWATLTYDDSNVPVTLQKSHLQDFLRKLRKRTEVRVRFFASGEYGEKFGRPHYHPILYGVDDEKVIQACWPFGLARRHDLRFEGIAYVAGYVQKKFVFREEPEERVDYSTGEVYVYQPPFIQMSRKPGIGADAAGEFARSWRNTAMYKGRHVRVPRYLHAAWEKSASFKDVLERAIEVAENREEVDWDRLAAGEQIAQADMELQSRRRSL
jgi:hypothetical protein